MEVIERLYNPLHEASELKFVDTVNHIIKRKKLPTLLQERREKCGLTQKELAEKAGISLRILQQYEIREKDINEATGSTLLALSKALGCKIEDIIEYNFDDVEAQNEANNDENNARTRMPFYGI